MQSIAGDRRDRLDRARLYLVIDARPQGRGIEQVVEPALRGGVDMVQLRDKSASDADVLAAAEALRSLCDEHGALMLVNDRPDLARQAGADGVHLGQDDGDLDAVRAELGPDVLIGLSTHSREQVDAAMAGPADYLGVGPVFATPTKPGRPPVGLALVRYAAATAAKPFFAIGGIDAARARLVARAGATRVAVVRAIRDAHDPEAAAAALRCGLLEEAVVGAGR